MDAAIVTVGDELLAGDTENTNATWLARQLTDRGVAVRRALTLPDDRAAIAGAVRTYAADYDAVLVTGGLGGTHDDVTMEAVADALDRGLTVDAEAREAVAETVAAFREDNPDLVERFPEMDIDLDAQASVPAGARALVNPVGLSPGCVCENVYVMPGIPEEMRAVFDLVEGTFGGDVVSETVHTPAPEAAAYRQVDAVRERFDVSVGSYPARDGGLNRIKVTATDPDALDGAVAYLREHLAVVDPPAGTEGDGSDAAG